MDSRDVILEMVDVVKNQALRLTDRMVTVNALIRGPIFQANIFDMVHHMRDAGEAAGTLLVPVPFITPFALMVSLA